jgi:hypothetical protein
MNKFLITGMPRCGTTVVVKTLSKLNDVFVYDDPHGFGEPFKIFNTSLELNPYIRLDRIENNCKSKFFGFKCFPGDLVSITRLNEKRNYKTFAIIRKDLWKSTFSHAIAKTKLFRDNQQTFDVSSKLHTQDPAYNTLSELPLPLRNLLRESYFHRVKGCYEFETQWKNTDIIYFEDLIKPNASFECLNNYFGQEIIFNLDYDDSHDIGAYYSNFSPAVLEELSKFMIKTIVLPDDCPEYIKESVYKFIK